AVAALALHPSSRTTALPLLGHGMDLSDVSSRKLHDNRLAFLSFVWRYEYLDAACFCLSKRILQICHFISGHFAAVGIRKVSVGDESGQFAEPRFDPPSPIGLCRLSDFNTWSARFIRDHASVGKREKAAHERIDPILRHVNSILRNRLEW